ncbi:MAG: hypothetical protein ACRDGA_12415 [Bacteroidota bacterium]
MKKSQVSQAERTIIMMLGYLCVSTEIESSLPRKVQILDRFDLADKDIAKICGCTVPSVANARQSLKKRPNA